MRIAARRRGRSSPDRILEVAALAGARRRSAVATPAWRPVDSLPSCLTLQTAPVVDRLGALFADAGHELHLVGGSVRDALLGQLGHDLDFTTSARPDAVEALLRRFSPAVWTIGKEFGTIGCRVDDDGVAWVIEVTTYRSDAYAGTSRKPVVAFGDTLDGDLVRRDFTINAMALSLPDKTFHDPYGGLTDLARGVIRTPAAPEISFSDDPLRMMRAARFAAQLDFEVAPEVVAGDDRDGGPDRDHLRRAGPRRADPAAAGRPGPAAGWTCWSAPGWPTGCCPSCRRCGWSATSTTGTRTSTSTA